MNNNQDISKVKINSQEYNIKDSWAREQLVKLLGTDWKNKAKENESTSK